MDLDHDGHRDLLSGGYPGKLWVFRGSGDGEFAKRVALTGADGKPLTPGPAATVHAVDWDGDGDLDLLAGNIKGAVFYFANEGSDAKPQYAGKAPIRAGGKPLVVHDDSGPVTADWDGDGTLDLLVGCGDGAVVFCRGVPGQMPRKLEAPVTLIEKSKGAWASGFGVRAKVCPVDWNGDGKLDLLVGTYTQERPPPKDLDEMGKAHLADLKTQLKKVSATYEKARLALFAEAANKPNLTSQNEMTPEDWKKFKKFFEAGGESVDQLSALMKKGGTIKKEISQLEGTAVKILGRVWLFPGK